MFTKRAALLALTLLTSPAGIQASLRSGSSSSHATQITEPSVTNVQKATRPDSTTEPSVTDETEAGIKITSGAMGSTSDSSSEAAQTTTDAQQTTTEPLVEQLEENVEADIKEAEEVVSALPDFSVVPAQLAAAFLSVGLLLNSLSENARKLAQDKPASTCAVLTMLVGCFCWTMMVTLFYADIEMLTSIGYWSSSQALFATAVLMTTPVLLLVPSQQVAKKKFTETFGREAQQAAASCFETWRHLAFQLYLVLVFFQVTAIIPVHQLAGTMEVTMKKALLKVEDMHLGGDSSVQLSEIKLSLAIPFLYAVLAWCNLCVVYERLLGGNFISDFPDEILAVALNGKSCIGCLAATRSMYHSAMANVKRFTDELIFMKTGIDDILKEVENMRRDEAIDEEIAQEWNLYFGKIIGDLKKLKFDEAIRKRVTLLPPYEKEPDITVWQALASTQSGEFGWGRVVDHKIFGIIDRNIENGYEQFRTKHLQKLVDIADKVSAIFQRLMMPTQPSEKKGKNFRNDASSEVVRAVVTNIDGAVVRFQAMVYKETTQVLKTLIKESGHYNDAKFKNCSFRKVSKNWKPAKVTIEASMVFIDREPFEEIAEALRTKLTQLTDKVVPPLVDTAGTIQMTCQTQIDAMRNSMKQLQQQIDDANVIGEAAKKQSQQIIKYIQDMLDFAEEYKIISNIHWYLYQVYTLLCLAIIMHIATKHYYHIGFRSLAMCVFGGPTLGICLFAGCFAFWACAGVLNETLPQPPELEDAEDTKLKDSQIAYMPLQQQTSETPPDASTLVATPLGRWRVDKHGKLLPELQPPPEPKDPQLPEYEWIGAAAIAHPTICSSGSGAELVQMGRLEDPELEGSGAPRPGDTDWQNVRPPPFAQHYANKIAFSAVEKSANLFGFRCMYTVVIAVTLVDAVALALGAVALAVAVSLVGAVALTLVVCSRVLYMSYKGVEEVVELEPVPF